MDRRSLRFPLLLAAAAFVGWAQGAAAGPGSSPSPTMDRVAARGELIVGTAASMPPLNMKTKDGEVIGLDLDLAKILAAGMEAKLRVETMPFADLLPALEAGKVDLVLSGMTMTPARNRKFAFVGPYFVSGKSLVAKKATVATVKKGSDLNVPEMTLAALNGSTSAAFVEKALPKAKLVTVKDYDEGIALVLDDRASALVADHPICEVSAYRHRDRGLVALKEKLTFEPLGVALPPNDPLLVNWAQNVLLGLEGSGDLGKLRKRWFEDTDWLEKLP
jgi:polar amino acid transport system substrate-binding protein